ncbi:hypothetical protein vseg_014295 [Gypsophila vaccaria]
MALEESLPTPNSETDEAPHISALSEKPIGNLSLRKTVLRRGTSWQTPSHGDEVEVHYSGHVQGSGCSLGSSYDQGTSFKFKLRQGEVIEGLDEGIATMKKGEKAIFTIPPNIAYGEAGFPPLVPPNSSLIFEVDMISWSTIRDVTGDGGVLKRIIVEGDGWASPKDGDEVSVKYEAKLEDGKLLSKSEDTVIFHVGDGKLCHAIHNAVKTMRRNEKVELCIKFDYGFGLQDVTRANNKGGCTTVIPNVTILLELLSWRSVVDILGDKKLLKKIICAGEGLDHPNEGSSVKVTYICKLEDGTIVEQKGSAEEPFEYICLEDQVIEGLDRAVMTMKKGEKAQVFIDTDLLQGTEISKTVCGHSRLIYVVELLDFTKAKPFWKMETEEKIEACEKKKQEGNSLFKAKKFWLASKKYEKAATYVQFNHNFSDEEKHTAKVQLLSCDLNNAACKLKLGDYVGAAKLCTKVLELDPNNTKALFRRSQAYLNTSDLDKAEADIRKALKVDPNNKDIKLVLKMIKDQQKEHALHQAQLFGTMISKMV